MAVYGYIRVSTNRQDGDNQRYSILEFANGKKLGTIDFVDEVVSGTVGWQKRQLADLMDRLKKGDTLIVAELSRLGRSMLEIMELLSIMTKKGVRIHAIKGNYELGDNIQSKVLAFAFALAAEVERELISSRTKEALSRRRAEGKPLGRPKGSTGRSKLDGREEQIRELLRHRVAKAAIARILNISRPALLDFIKSRSLNV
ncbi:MAG: resolvase [Geobacter sp.]|nr:MAG: resolvase [Geobacter sp.]